MDTNLKRFRKVKNLIITLVILVPALVLTALYPQMEKAMLDKKEQWLSAWEKQKEQYELEQQEKEQLSDIFVKEDTAIATDISMTEEIPVSEMPKQFYLQDNFVNYAVEASYYQYAMFLQDVTGVQSFTEVLDAHGWINDYYEFTEVVPYYVKYGYEDENKEQQTLVMSNPPEFSSEEELEKLILGESLDTIRETQMKADGYLGYLEINYDSYGKLVNIRMNVDERVEFDGNLYSRAKNSIEQYETNATYYEQEPSEANQQMRERALEICPKNFQAIYLIYADNEKFVNDFFEEGPLDLHYDVEPYYAPEDLYFATGAYWIELAAVLFVFAAAMILPFFKKLETGWEKLFSISAEMTLLIAAAAIALGVGMSILMSHTTMTGIESFLANGNAVELLGYQFDAGECYNMLIAVNFLGWTLAFFLEYICVTNMRQFFARPKYYICHRLIVVRLVLWIHNKIKKLVNEVLDIDIHEKMHSSIVKIVVANGLITALLCCIWFAGTLGVVIYSAVLYVLLKKYGSKLQKQYQSILSATSQMADGDLHITLEEDLGIFASLGEELEGVQKGFAKAVAEEAKSQNMKSELITNVSHDLKTPLTAIITYVDLLKNSEITEEERNAYIETLEAKSQRLKVLIEDLFEVSKANSGNVHMNFMDVDVVKLLKEVRVELLDKIEQSNLDFRWKLPDEKVILRLDGQKTYRVFENIISNAMKYSMPFTRVYIDMAETESEVVITFKNMSAQELRMDVDYLTERFVRGDSSRNSEGSGLGLAIAKSFTELQKGQFEISVDGDLFKVCIKFPKGTI